MVNSYAACSVSDTFAWVTAGRFPCWYTQFLCGQQIQLPLVGTWSVRLGVNGWLVLLKYDVNCEFSERWFVAVVNPGVKVTLCLNVWCEVSCRIVTWNSVLFAEVYLPIGIWVRYRLHCVLLRLNSRRINDKNNTNIEIWWIYLVLHAEVRNLCCTWLFTQQMRPCMSLSLTCWLKHFSILSFFI